MDGTQNRTRTCDNPEPELDGNECDGLATEYGTCILVVNGGWSAWSSYSSCSKECGGGTKTRSRSCTNPAPSNGGAYCPGDATQTSSCNTQSCPSSDIIDLPCGGCDIDGSSTWGNWDYCPSGTYARGIESKLDTTNSFWHDKEGMTGVGIRCSDGGFKTSSQTSGGWTGMKETSSALTGGELKYKDKGLGATGVRGLTCDSGETLDPPPLWNEGWWKGKKRCPANTVVVGIRTRVDRSWDKAGIVAVSFWCQYMPDAYLSSKGCYSSLR